MIFVCAQFAVILACWVKVANAQNYFIPNGPNNAEFGLDTFVMTRPNGDK
jgi:hypothetical protein